MHHRFIHTNLDMEGALTARAEGRAYTRPRVVQKICARWSALLRLMGGWADAAVVDTPEAARDAASRGEVLWWGDPEALAALEANSKITSLRMAEALGVGLPGAQVVDDMETLRALVREAPWSWILKHPLGVSGRDAVRGRPGPLEDRLARWAERAFAAGWPLVLEPRVELEAEWSWHLDLTPSGAHTLLGACTLLAGNGALRGHLLTPDHPLPDPALVSAVAARLHAMGYAGPVSVDAMRGTLHDGATTRHIERPISEINARHTFGRMALALRHHAPPDWTLLWWHPPGTPATDDSPLHPNIHTPGRHALPAHVDPAQASGTVVFAAPDLTALRALLPDDVRV